MDSLNVKCDSVNYTQGNEATFINKLLDEMKFKFNKTEDVSDDESVQEEAVESEVQSVSSQKEDNNEKNDIDEKNGCDSPELPLVFKKPQEESVTDMSPSKRSVRQKKSVLENQKEENTVKRSSRRRSRDHKESVLQSAIARKEKSYNESNKPQRLTRQLKPTLKVLENIASARQEKPKVKVLKNNDKNNEFEGQSNTDDTNCIDISNNKKLKKRIKSCKKSAKKSKISIDESIVNTESDESISDTTETPAEILKNARRSQRISTSLKRDDCESPNLPDQANNIPDDPESSSISDISASRLCLCTQTTKLYSDANENETVFCAAIDSIEDKLIGCSRVADIRSTPLLRPSQRIPYLILCDQHKARLNQHNCCPTCGLFCTQGRFLECESKHQYHRNCQLSLVSQDCCPHCGSSANSREIYIELHCPKKPIFLPVQKLDCPQARMTFTFSRDLLNCDTPPLLPIESFQNIVQFDDSDQEFTENDLVDAFRDEDAKKLAAIIASDCLDLHFKIPDFNEGTLLHYAAQNGLLEICHLLLLANLEINELDKEQNTPLMLAIAAGKNDIVQYLVRSGANISLKGTDGMTSLHIAAKCGQLTAAKLILKASLTVANFVNCQDDGGWTPLVWACEHGHLEVASYLLAKGADPFFFFLEHNEALHWAVFSGNSSIVQLLLDEGCDVNTMNAHGETPLHIAAREDRYNCIVVLLARGAMVSLLNKNNETPLDCVPDVGESYNIIALNIKLQAVTGSDFQKYKAILSNDISKGREINPIQCINTIDNESEPKNYIYISKNIINSDMVKIDTKISSVESCKCQDRCISEDCSCGKKSVKCWYDDEGKLSSDFNFSDGFTIFECNDLCSCNAITCRNRVVQRGLTQRFQVYKTPSKGWGVKTLRPISKGSYVCEYVGEILTGTEVDRKEDDSYVFDLHNSDTESFCVDARQYGNLSRFINHSCTPNLYPIKVFIDHQDLRFPRIAFFAVKDVSAEEELSFDYGQKFWEVKYKSFTCACESSECRYSEDKIEETLQVKLDS